MFLYLDYILSHATSLSIVPEIANPRSYDTLTTAQVQRLEHTLGSHKTSGRLSRDGSIGFHGFQQVD